MRKEKAIDALWGEVLADPQQEWRRNEGIVAITQGSAIFDYCRQAVSQRSALRLVRHAAHNQLQLCIFVLEQRVEQEVRQRRARPPPWEQLF